MNLNRPEIKEFTRYLSLISCLILRSQNFSSFSPTVNKEVVNLSFSEFTVFCRRFTLKLTEKYEEDC